MTRAELLRHDKQSGASQYVRSRTLNRAVREYLRYVRETFGYATILYIVAWGSVALISTIQNLGTAPELLLNPLPLPVILATAVFIGLLGSVCLSRVPPIILDRRDLFRLALTPVTPGDVLLWPLWKARTARILLGLIVGGAWSLLLPVLYGMSAPYAALAAALLMSASLDLSWMGYAARSPVTRDATRPWLLAASLITLLGVPIGMLTPFGLESALHGASLLSLALPCLLAVITYVGAQRSMRDAYPEQFPVHAQILGQLKALSFGTKWLQVPVNPDVKRRLQAQLNGSPSAIRPNRFIPAPPTSWGVTGALAWRGGLLLVRRSALDHLLVVLLFGFMVIATPTAANNVLIQVMMAMALGQLVVRLIAPAPGPGLLTVYPRERTLGRVLPIVACCFPLGVLGILGDIVFGHGALTPVVLLVSLQVILAAALHDKMAAFVGGELVPEVRFGLSLATVLLSILLPVPLALVAITIFVTGLLWMRWP